MNPYRHWVSLAVVTGLYVLAGKFGLSLAFVHASASAVWPPSGLALAALLLFGFRLWPAVFVGAFIVNITTAGGMATSLAIASGNTLEAVVGAWLISQFARGRHVFERTADVLKYVALAAGASNTISATIGVGSLCLAGEAAWSAAPRIWVTWWLGDLIGDLVVAPLLMIWATPRMARGRWWELAVMLAVTLTVAHSIFSGWPYDLFKPYPYMAIPLVVLAAFRLGHHGAVATSFLLGAVAIAETLHGSGPFALADPNLSLLMLQAFLGTTTVLGLLISAALLQRHRAERALAGANLALQAAIEHRAHVEAQLRDEGQRLLLVLEAGRMGTWEWIVETGQTSWSPGLEAIHGLAPGTFNGTFEGFLSDIHTEDRQRVIRTIQEAVEQRTDLQLTYRIVLPDGTQRWVEGKGRLMVDERGRPQRMSGVCVDITEHKQAEERIQSLNRHLHERAEALTHANRELEAFSYSVSHDLRAPLRAIHGFTKLLQSEHAARLGEEGLRLLQVVCDNVTRMDRLIDSLLHLSRMARLEVRKRCIRMDSLMESIVQELRVAEPGRALEMTIHPLPDALGDEALIRQVFSNLIGNAMKFTRNSTKAAIEIGASFTDQEVVYYVKDNGVGFDMRYADKLFRAFERLHSVNEFEGTGIGLAIVQRIVQAHAGRVWAHSAVGQGATFFVSLPVVAPSHEAEPALQQPQPQPV